MIDPNVLVLVAGLVISVVVVGWILVVALRQYIHFSITHYRADYLHAATKYLNHLHVSIVEWDGTRTELFSDISPDLNEFLQHTMRMVLIETKGKIREKVREIHDADAELRGALSEALDQGKATMDKSVVEKIEAQQQRIQSISQMVSL